MKQIQETKIESQSYQKTHMSQKNWKQSTNETNLQHFPHIGADMLGGEVAGQGHGLLVELHDAVGEDVVDGLRNTVNKYS